MSTGARGEGTLFVTSEGFSHENGHNSETKSRKMLPKVAKRPKRRGLGPYSKKTKFLSQNFSGHLWPCLTIFWPFWSELYEGATFGGKFVLPVVQNGNPP